MPDGRIFPVSVPFFVQLSQLSLHRCRDGGACRSRDPLPHILIYFAAFTDVMCGLAPLYQYRKPSMSILSPTFSALTAL